MNKEKIKEEVLEEICKAKQAGEIPTTKLKIEQSVKIANDIQLMLDLAIQKTAEEIFDEIEKEDCKVTVCRKCNTFWAGIIHKCEDCGNEDLEHFIYYDDIEDIKKKWLAKV